jgi:membrane protease YdiL (CAAX protease family)
LKDPAGKIPLRRQLTTCAVLCTVAVIVILLFHRKPYLPTLLAGLPVAWQILLGLAVGLLYWAATTLGARRIAQRKTTKSIAENYSRLDLSGWNPIWIAVAAGFGEELLFRGALQPLIGIWLASVLFVLLHVRAYRMNNLSKRVLIQSISIFCISVALGFVAAYAGLITAMLVHTSMDVVGLFAIRRMMQTATVTAEAA